MAETLAQLEAKLSRYQRSGIMSKSKIDGVKKQIADKKKQQQKQAKTGVSDAQKQRQLKVPAKPQRSSAINPNSNTRGKSIAQRRKERKNKPFFKGNNITLSQAQRDKLEGGAGKGSSVIKNILTKIDNAKTLEAENKQRQRFEKLFGVVAPKSAKTYEKVEQTSAKMPEPKKDDKKVKRSVSVSSVDEMGGVGPDASAPTIKQNEPKKTETSSKIVGDDKKAKNKPKRSVVKDSDRLGIKIARMLGDERSSSQMVKDRIENEKLEDEMNFRKGGMAFGKGGMYKTPKKAYGMRYGGVTRKLKG